MFSLEEKMARRTAEFLFSRQNFGILSWRDSRKRRPKEGLGKEGVGRPRGAVVWGHHRLKREKVPVRNLPSGALLRNIKKIGNIELCLTPALCCNPTVMFPNIQYRSVKYSRTLGSEGDRSVPIHRMNW